MRLAMSKFNGLLPVLDRRRVQEPFCLDGRNFYVDVDGPVSGFGRRQILFANVADPTYIQDVYSEDVGFIISKDAIFQWDEDNSELIPIYTFTALAQPWPWSHVYVGGYHYFISKNTNLLQYDAGTGTWVELTGGYYPVNARALGECNGRLIVVSAGATTGEAGVVQYSAIDDGTDFVPDINTGAGAQSLAILGSGEPYAILRVADGFITVTASGLLKSTALNSINPFHHRALSTAHKVINPYCVVPIAQDTFVLLTEQGLFSTSGGIPAEWQPIMGEYLHDVILPNLILDSATLIRLFYSAEKRWFIVSIASREIPYIYNRAYVLYEPSGQFGSFDRSHCAFLNLKPLDDNSIGFDFGMCDTDGNLFVFEKAPYDSVTPAMLYNYSTVHGIPQYPVRDVGGVKIFPSVTRGTTWDESLADEPGVYRTLSAEGESETVSVVNDIAALDAYIDIGLVRMTDERAMDQASLITGVGIGMLSGPVGDEFDDWLNDYPSDIDIDYETLSGDEDYGLVGAVFTTECDCTLKSTLDGYNVWNGQDNLLEAAIADNRYTQYPAYNLGLYHYLRLTAFNSGQSFHLKTAEFNAVLAGRLQ